MMRQRLAAAAAGVLLLASTSEVLGTYVRTFDRSISKRPNRPTESAASRLTLTHIVYPSPTHRPTCAGQEQQPQSPTFSLRRLPPAGDTKATPCSLPAAKPQPDQQQPPPDQQQPPTNESVAAAVAAAQQSRIGEVPKGVHCKLQWIWTVSPVQAVRLDGLVLVVRE